MDREALYDFVVQYLQPYQPQKISVFGSYARGTNTPDSDLDILVEFHDIVNLLDLIGIEQELQEQTGVKIDLLTDPSLSPLLRKEIEKDLKVIFDKS